MKGLGGRFWPFAHFLQIHQLLFGRFSAFNDPPSDPYIISNDFYCFIWSSFMRGFHWYAFCTYLGWFRGSYVKFNFCLLFSSENISISVPDYHIFIFKKVTKFENCQMCLKLHKIAVKIKRSLQGSPVENTHKSVVRDKSNGISRFAKFSFFC